MVNPKYNLRNIVISFIVFATSIYFISLSRFPTWIHNVIQNGTEEYNMLVELYYVLPYVGWHISTFQLIAIHVVSFGLALLTYYLMERESSVTDFVRFNPVSIIFIMISVPVLMISLSADDCVVGLDDILRTIANDTVAYYINLGPTQLSIIATLVSIIGIYALINDRELYFDF